VSEQLELFGVEFIHYTGHVWCSYSV